MIALVSITLALKGKTFRSPGFYYSRLEKITFPGSGLYYSRLEKENRCQLWFLLLLGLKGKTFDSSRVSITLDLKERIFDSSGFCYSRLERENL